MSDRDGNRSIPALDRGRPSSSAHGHTSTAVPTTDSELPIISNQPKSIREMESLAGPFRTIMSPFGVHFLGSGSTISEEVVTSSTKVPSTGVHQSSVPLRSMQPLYGSSKTAPHSRSPPSYRSDNSLRPATPPPSYRSDNSLRPATPPPSYRSDNSLRPATPPPSYQEVIEGGYPELLPTYKHTVLHRETDV